MYIGCWIGCALHVIRARFRVPSGLSAMDDGDAPPVAPAGRVGVISLGAAQVPPADRLAYITRCVAVCSLHAACRPPLASMINSGPPLDGAGVFEMFVGADQVPPAARDAYQVSPPASQTTWTV